MECDGPVQVLLGDAAAPRQRDAWTQSHVLEDPGPRAEAPHHLGRGLKSAVREGWGLREGPPACRLGRGLGWPLRLTPPFCSTRVTLLP